MGRTGRKEPYTEIGIRRMTCARDGCTNKAHAQWQICADGNTYRPICKACDVLMNEVAMTLMFGDRRKKDLAAYREKVLGDEP